MVGDLFKYIGEKLKSENLFVNSFSVNAIQVPNGEIIPLNRLDDGDAIGIDDSLGNSFYIKISDTFNYSEETRLSSCQKEYRQSVPFKFVFFSPILSNNFSPLQIEQKFINTFRNLKFGEYTGEERRIVIQLIKSNINSIANFESEMKLKYESATEMKIISIEGNLNFLSSIDCSICI